MKYCYSFTIVKLQSILMNPFPLFRIRIFPTITPVSATGTLFSPNSLNIGMARPPLIILLGSPTRMLSRSSSWKVDSESGLALREPRRKKRQRRGGWVILLVMWLTSSRPYLICLTREAVKIFQKPAILHQYRQSEIRRPEMWRSLRHLVHQEVEVATFF